MNERTIYGDAYRAPEESEPKPEHWYDREMKARIVDIADEAIAMCRQQNLQFAAYLFEVAKEELRSTTN